jgi:hypothetical protein
MPQGEAFVSWERKPNTIEVKINLPKGVSGYFIGGGNKAVLVDGENSFVIVL